MPLLKLNPLDLRALLLGDPIAANRDTLLRGLVYDIVWFSWVRHCSPGFSM